MVLGTLKYVRVALSEKIHVFKTPEPYTPSPYYYQRNFPHCVGEKQEQEQEKKPRT